MTHPIASSSLAPRLLWFLAASSLSAQSVIPPVGAQPERAGADVLVLSPFAVQSDRDNGYQATSTLAGTRLNTPVKDLAASISI